MYLDFYQSCIYLEMIHISDRDQWIGQYCWRETFHHTLSWVERMMPSWEASWWSKGEVRRDRVCNVLESLFRIDYASWKSSIDQTYHDARIICHWQLIASYAVVRFLWMWPRVTLGYDSLCDTPLISMKIHVPKEQSARSPVHDQDGTWKQFWICCLLANSSSSSCVHVASVSFTSHCITNQLIKTMTLTLDARRSLIIDTNSFIINTNYTDHRGCNNSWLQPQTVAWWRISCSNHCFHMPAYHWHTWCEHCDPGWRRSASWFVRTDIYMQHSSSLVLHSDIATDYWPHWSIRWRILSA